MDVKTVSINWTFKEDKEKERQIQKNLNQTNQRVATKNETLEEAWTRIHLLKNSSKDIERIKAVQQALKKGTLTRDEDKKLSKAEVMSLHKDLLETERVEKIKQLVAKTPANYRLVATLNDLTELKQVIETSNLIAFDIETYGVNLKNEALDPYKGRIAGFSISTNHNHYYVPLEHRNQDIELYQLDLGTLTQQYIMRTLKKPLENAKIVMHNAQFDIKFMKIAYDIDLVDALLADTRIMAFMLDENRSHRLKDLTTDWLNEQSDNFDELFGSTPFNEVSLDAALVYAAGDTEKTLNLYRWIQSWFNKREDLRKLGDVFYTLEMPVCRAFIRSDLNGIDFDKEKAALLDAEYEREERKLEVEIRGMLNAPKLNINSPAQLSKKLYGELKLTDPDQGSTGVKTLKKIKHEHEVIPKILDIRELSKLRSSFTQALPKEVQKDGKIHASFNTVGAKTFRFSCKSPNLQQVPAKRPEIRKLFQAEKDRILISIDYSQIELRVLAHLANEKVLIDAFHEGRDIHSTTASMISSYSYEEIEASKDVEGHLCQKARKQAKIVNFGLIYGMSAKGLADTLEITEKEAKRIMKDYFKGYPGIKGYMDKQHKQVKDFGYITDMFGRKRRLHEQVKDYTKLYGALRQAGNYPIQASAGGILKRAIVDLQHVLPEMETDILLAVHDELVFSAPKTIQKDEIYRIKETMEKAVKLIVPVICDVEISPVGWMDSVTVDDYYA